MKISLSAFVAACFSLSINSISADHLLEYSVILDLTDRFDITINTNKENDSEDNPAPTLCTSALTIIAGDLLNMVFPVNDRKPNLDYPVIQPECHDDNRMDCSIEYDLTEFWPVEFDIKLLMKSELSPGINLESLEPDEKDLLQNKLITVELEIELTAKSSKDEAVALMQLKSVIDEIFVVDEEDVTYSITDLDDVDEDVENGDHDEF